MCFYCVPPGLCLWDQNYPVGLNDTGMFVRAWAGLAIFNRATSASTFVNFKLTSIRCCVSVMFVAMSVMNTVLSDRVTVDRLGRAAVWYCISLANMAWLAWNSYMCAAYPDVCAVIFDLRTSLNSQKKNIFQLSHVFSAVGFLFHSLHPSLKNVVCSTKEWVMNRICARLYRSWIATAST